jgi:phosphatidate cytidylyltransferase
MLKTRIITAVVLLVVLLAVLYSNSFPVFVLVAAAFLGAAAWESSRLFQSKLPWAGAALCALAFILIVFLGDRARWVYLYAACVAIWGLRLAPSLRVGLPAIGTVRNRLLNVLYAVAIVGSFIAIAALYLHSGIYLLSVMAIVWVADIGAYFAGKAFGKHKLAPRISPGKSWEGAIGGWAAALLIASATLFIPGLGDSFAPRVQARWGWGGFAVIYSILVAASIAGDLFESQLKRRVGAKDSSNLLPGHGGVLDRIDALIPALPIALLFDHWL